MKLVSLIWFVFPINTYAREFLNPIRGLSNDIGFLADMKKNLQETKEIIQKKPEEEVNSIKRIAFNMTGLPPLDIPKPDFNKLEYLSHYAGAAYCSKWALENWQCSHCVQIGIDIKFMGIFEDVLTGGLGYIAVDNEKQIINLVFRGSSNIRNWIMDLSMSQLPYKIAGDEALVHSGFITSVNALKISFIPMIKSLIEKYPQYQISVIGHSLGGAVATLALVELKSALNIPWSKLNLYTYGEPRVGNSFFAIWLNNNLLNQFRVVNQYDLVPTVPFTWLNYAHHQREILIQRDRYKACVVSNIYLEDVSCAPDIKKLTIMDHIAYFGQIMGLGC